MNVVPMKPLAHWYVTLTLAGDPWPEQEISDALQRLMEERPLLQSCRYSADTLELRYWEQAEDVGDAAALALRLWSEHRKSAGLPDWQLVGLEVVDRNTFHRRLEGAPFRTAPVVTAELRPL